MPVKPAGKRSPLKMRFGAQVPMALGMHRRGSAALIPDAAFYHLENGIFVGPNVRERPGQQRATNAVMGPIEGMCDTSDIGAAINAEAFVPQNDKVFVYSPRAATNKRIFKYQTSDSTKIRSGQINLGLPSEAGQGYLADDGSSLVYLTGVSFTGQAKIWSLSRASLLTDPLPSTFTATTVDTWTAYAASTFATNYRDPGTGALFIGAFASSIGRIVRYSGGVFTEEYTLPTIVGSATWGILAPRGSEIVGGFGLIVVGTSTAEYLQFHVRSAGGTWSALPNPGGNYACRGFAGAILATDLYLAGWRMLTSGSVTEAAIFKYNGSSLTLERVIPGSVGTANFAGGIAAIGNALYYLWKDEPGGAPKDWYIGKYDGATWTDVFVSLRARFPSMRNYEFGFIGNYGGGLVVFLTSTTADGGGSEFFGAFYRSPNNDLAAFVDDGEVADLITGSGGGSVSTIVDVP